LWHNKEMNMPNKFIRNLSTEEISRLEQLWQTSDNFRLRNRSQAILLSFQKVSIDEIAKICQVGRDAVSSWIRKWEKRGEAGLKDEPKSGRPPKLSAIEEEEALKLALKMPNAPNRQLAEIKKQTGKEVSRGILKRVLKKNIGGNESNEEKPRNTIKKSSSEPNGN
jgi:transposase